MDEPKPADTTPWSIWDSLHFLLGFLGFVALFTVVPIILMVALTHDVGARFVAWLFLAGLVFWCAFGWAACLLSQKRPTTFWRLGFGCNNRIVMWMLATTFLLVMVPCLGFSVYEFWKGLGYTWQIKSALAGDISHVEFQLNYEGARYRLQDKDRIEQLKAWLSATQQDSIIRSAPPWIGCELRFVFTDGREVELQTSDYRKAADDHGNVRDDVRIRFGKYTRSGPTEMLAVILDPNAPGVILVEVRKSR